MATESPLLHDGSQTTAAADLSAAANQYKAVKLVGARSVNLDSTGGVAIYGILQNLPSAGDAADVGIFGVSKAKIGAAGCAAGDSLMTDNTSAFTTKTSTNVVVAVALEAGASGDIISVKIIPTPG
jgi:hypothetical protein